MSNKSVCPCLRLEVPHHKARVHGTCSQLLHVGIEGDAGHCISVAFEVPFQRRVLLQGGILINAHHVNITLTAKPVAKLYAQSRWKWPNLTIKIFVRTYRVRHCVGKSSTSFFPAVQFSLVRAV